MARRQSPPKNKKKDMAKRKGLESENPFTNLLNSLKEGKLGHNQIQIAYRAWIRESDYVPDAIKDVLGGSASQSGLLFGMFKSISQVIGAMELVYRRAYDIGYEDGIKKNIIGNEIRKLKAALKRIKKVEEDCIKNNRGYNDIIYQVCIRVLSARRGKGKKI